MFDPELQPEDRTNAFHPSCEFQGRNGKIVYCVECRRMALEYSEHRMVFHREDAESVVQSLRQSLQEARALNGNGRIHVHSVGDGECMELPADHVQEAAGLVEMAVLIIDTETR